MTEHVQAGDGGDVRSSAERTASGVVVHNDQAVCLSVGDVEHASGAVAGGFRGAFGFELWRDALGWGSYERANSNDV